MCVCSAHKCMLINRRVYEAVCVCVSLLAPSNCTGEKKKGLQTLYDVRMEQLNTHGGGESCSVNKNKLPPWNWQLGSRKKKKI